MVQCKCIFVLGTYFSTFSTEAWILILNYGALYLAWLTFVVEYVILKREGLEGWGFYLELKLV